MSVDWDDLDVEFEALRASGVAIDPKLDGQNWHEPPPDDPGVADTATWCFKLPGDQPQPAIVGAYAMLIWWTGQVPDRGDAPLWSDPMGSLMALCGSSLVFTQGQLWAWDGKLLIWIAIDLQEIRRVLLRMGGCYTERHIGKRKHPPQSKTFLESSLETALTGLTLDDFFAVQRRQLSDGSEVTGAVQVGSWLYLASATKLERIRPTADHRQRFRVPCELPVDEYGDISVGGIPIDPTFFNMVPMRDRVFFWKTHMPIFVGLLDDVLPDYDQQEVLRQLMGGALMGMAGAWQKHLWMAGLGKGRNGKGLIKDILAMICGVEHVQGVEVGMVRKTEYLRQGLDTARVLSVSEASDLTKADAEWLKIVTGGDQIKIRWTGYAGHSAPISGIWLFASNSLPTGFFAGAIMRRMVVLSFDREIPEERAIPWPTLRARLLPELPLIVTWALGGVRNYQQYGLWPCKASEGLHKELRQSTPGIESWIEANVHYKADGELSSNIIFDAYERYRMFQKSRGRRVEDVTLIELARRLRPHLKRSAGEQEVERVRKSGRVWRAELVPE